MNYFKPLTKFVGMAVLAISLITVQSTTNSAPKQDPNIIRVNTAANVGDILKKLISTEPVYNDFKKDDTLTVNRKTNTFYLYTITSEGAAVFEAESNLMIANGAKDITINLHSPGGEVDAAWSMSHQIKILKEEGAKITTIVDAQNGCMSACPIIFLSGDERIAASNAVFMFHSPYIQIPYNASESDVMEYEYSLRETRFRFAKLLDANCPTDLTLKKDVLDHGNHFYRADAIAARCTNTFITKVIPVAEKSNPFQTILHL